MSFDADAARLADQLAERYGLNRYTATSGYDIPPCEACGAPEDVHICPGPEMQDFEWRCDDCPRFPQWFWQPGDHPSLLYRRHIVTCDDCGAEFTGVFGVTFWIDSIGRGDHEMQHKCLQCVDPERVQRVLEHEVVADGGTTVHRRKYGNPRVETYTREGMREDEERLKVVRPRVCRHGTLTGDGTQEIEVAETLADMPAGTAWDVLTALADHFNMALEEE